MRFKCSKQELLKGLNIVSKAVSSRTTIPVLKGILLTAKKDGTLKLSSSDLDISIETEILSVTEEEGSTVVLAKLFMDIVRKLPDDEIIFTEENNNIILKSGKSEFEIIGMDANEFPNFIDNNNFNDKINIDGIVLGEMIKKTAFSASLDEAKGIIVGVLIEIENNNINMIALDGFRMAVMRQKTETSYDARNIIISAKILGEIYKILAETEEDENVNIMLENKKALISINNTKIVLRLMEGEFVKYKDILPKENKTVFKADRTYLLESLERASLLAKEGKNNLVKLDIKDGLLTVTSKSEEGNVKEEIYIDKSGDDLEIGFNSKYIIEVLKAVSDENIKFEFNTGITPCLIKPIEGDSYDYLILPVRIANN